jgi:hypothetical protein
VAVSNGIHAVSTKTGIFWMVNKAWLQHGYHPKAHFQDWLTAHGKQAGKQQNRTFLESA